MSLADTEIFFNFVYSGKYTETLDKGKSKKVNKTDKQFVLVLSNLTVCCCCCCCCCLII